MRKMNYLEFFYYIKGEKEADKIMHEWAEFASNISDIAHDFGWDRTARLLGSENVTPYELLRFFEDGEHIDGSWGCYERERDYDHIDDNLWDIVDDDLYVTVEKGGHGWVYQYSYEPDYDYYGEVDEYEYTQKA